MTCVEKRQHVSHRNTMLHHRFPNGFTEIFLDETDREVSTLTDRAFRSLCIGDEAVYNDEFSYGYPFSCHKPLVEKPLEKTKDAGTKHQLNGAKDTQPWRQKESMSNVLIKNSDFKDPNGDSWDKSALFSIERELSEFSSDYKNLTAKKSDKNAKSSKTKNGQSIFKLRKLNIKNFFLHSEFSPFQSWRDFNRFPLGQDGITSILPVVDNLPKWYDSPLYKQLTEAHRIQTLLAEETEQQCQKPVEPPPPLRPPPKVLPKPSAPEKRSASDTSSKGETNAPWRRNRARAKSAVPVNQPGVLCPPTETPKLMEEIPPLYKKEVKSAKVKEVEKSCSLTNTPFSISQLMTPVILFRQATDTSEILSGVLSPSLLDLPLLDIEHVSPVISRSTSEVVKRDSYKSIASSLLFNLKDNRKRVKSRYSPPKFKTEQADRSTLSPKLLEQRLLKYAKAPSDGIASGFSTPAILASGLSTPPILLDGLPICSPAVSESSNAGLRKYMDSEISDDYLISNLLQTKREAAGNRSPGSPFTHSKVNKRSLTTKQTYPTLNLYKSPAGPEMKHFSPSLSKDTLSIATPNKGLSLNISDKTKYHPSAQKKGISLNIPEKPAKEMFQRKEKDIGDQPVHTITNTAQNKVASPNLPAAQNKVSSPNLTANAKQPTKDTVELKEEHIGEQTVNTREAITAIRETLTTAQNKVLFSKRKDHTKRSTKDRSELNVKYAVEEVTKAGLEAISTAQTKILSPNRTEAVEESTMNKNNIVKTEASQEKDDNAIVVEDRHSLHSLSVPSHRRIERQTTGETYPTDNTLTNGFIECAEKEKEMILSEKEKEPVKKQGRFKHVFSARQNNYIKSQRYAMKESGEKVEDEEDFEPKMEVNNKKDVDEEGHYAEKMVHKEMNDSEKKVSDLHALKELEKARLGEHLIKDSENLNLEPGIDRETKAKNNLISRELRNIKRGMLSMRGNTFAKKEAFVNKEKEQTKHNVFSKIDNNVVINKSLINDNYDKAKMALEEIISDREEKRKKKVLKNKEEDVNTVPGENTDDSCNVRVQERRQARQDSIRTAAEEEQKKARERLGDLRDHHHQTQEIITKTETQLGGNHRLGAIIYAEEKKLATRPIREDQETRNIINNVSDKQKYNIRSSKYSAEDSDRNVARQLSIETSDDTSTNDEVVREESQADAPVLKPEVPPRIKKGNTEKEDSTEEEKECGNVMNIIEEDIKNRELSRRDSTNDTIQQQRNTRARGKVSNREALDAKIKAERQTDALETEATTEHHTPIIQNNPQKKTILEDYSKHSKHPHETNASFSLSEEKEKERKALLNESQTNKLLVREPKAEQTPNSMEQQEQPCVRRKAPLKPGKDHSKPSNQVSITTEDESIMEKETMKKSQATEESNKSVKISEGIANVDEDIRELVSPLSNSSSINQSQQDQTSMSSKSSYFSVASSLQRNNETDSNIYHSLENLIAELEEVEEGVEDVAERVRWDLETKIEVEYYSVSDHENEEVGDKPGIPSRRDRETSRKEDNESRAREMDKIGWLQSPMDNTNSQTPTSQSNASSPVLGKPALFKVKDNTFKHHVSPVTKTVKQVLPKTNHDPVERAPWSPRESLSGSERSEEDPFNHLKESIEIPSPYNVATTPDKHLKPKETASPHSPQSPLSPSKRTPEHSQKGKRAPWSPRECLSGSERGEKDHLDIPEPHAAATTPDKHLKPKEVQSHHATHSPLSPTKLTPENTPKGQQYGAFLTVHQEDYIHSGVSPSSEGGTSTVDTADNNPEDYKVQSGSACSGNETQGPGRPPVVPPKSEKALLKAMKLTTRRIRKEEKGSQPHKSRSSRSDKNKIDKSSEHKNSSSDSIDKHCSSKKQHQERTEHISHSSEKHSRGESEPQGHSSEKPRQDESERQAYKSEKHHNGVPEHQSHNNEKPPTEKKEHSSHSSEKHRQGRSIDEQRHGESEHQGRKRDKQSPGDSKREGRSSEKHGRGMQEKRFHSSDRAVSENKRQNSERSTSERTPRHRAQSMDGHIGDKVEQRIRSSETSPRDRPVPRSQRIEKSIREELSQRGRAQERSNREKPENWNRSVDSYASDVIDLTSPHPNLSRQSSYTSQFSRQSSIEHGYASYPMTQRKLLQDPDSGQYFVVDMSVQVQTKTFFDPKTGNYVQLPVQPPEGPVSQASTVEVITAPMVLYHGSFVPVPVSSIPSQKSIVPASQLDQEDFEQRLERQRYKHTNDGHRYLEPVNGSQDHMLGEFLGTEDPYDCMS
ncbi:uncharacterized protein LOC112223510 [Oncorhynchus tshawytscha]|uniref:DUF4585 domain-containing protein n=1 Tax=Oncorhynchus tshawytscha TaxID=74940 RepID=A0A8C8IIH0_ONCTS|nr:uncharacterized protein LOC112223510 [Oncorhynchus tshawytscha]XP_042161385.1 uncharacterized protein LOC112223510 [Oncorhynchus tshawytscha]